MGGTKPVSISFFQEGLALSANIIPMDAMPEELVDQIQAG